MKLKILNKSRLLYNQYGLKTVTARMICKELDISLGSFSYHFPDKKVIVYKLYEQLQKDLQEVYVGIQIAEPDILVYLETHKKIFSIQEKYQFFYLNLFEILTNDKQIKKLHIENKIKERELAKGMFKFYSQAGILKEGISDAEIERLINLGQIINDFWLVDSLITAIESKSNRLSHYMKICCGILEPYLEEDAHKQFTKFFNQFIKSKNNR